jgi:hypothetical protein
VGPARGLLLWRSEMRMSWAHPGCARCIRRVVRGGGGTQVHANPLRKGHKVEGIPVFVRSAKRRLADN